MSAAVSWIAHAQIEDNCHRGGGGYEGAWQHVGGEGGTLLLRDPACYSHAFLKLDGYLFTVFSLSNRALALHVALCILA